MRKLNKAEIAKLNGDKRKALVRLKRIIGLLRRVQKVIQHSRVEDLHGVLGVAWDNGDEPERWAERLDEEVGKLTDRPSS